MSRKADIAAQWYQMVSKSENCMTPMLRKSAVENPEFREEIKAKRAAKKEARKAKRAARRFFPKLPGSQKQRQNAKNNLNSNLMMDGRWVVWGGSNTHIIKQDGERLGNYIHDTPP